MVLHSVFLFCGSQYAFVKEGNLSAGNVFVWLAFLKGLDSFFLLNFILQ